MRDKVRRWYDGRVEWTLHPDGRVMGDCGGGYSATLGPDHSQRYWHATPAEADRVRRHFAARDRASAQRRVRDQVCRDLGLRKVRGALGGTYWE